MSFHLVGSGWDTVFADAVKSDPSDVRIVCPFIKKGAVERLLNFGEPDKLKVITRFCLDDCAKGVSDLSALRLLLENGAKIRGVKKLHSKLYLFGRRAIVTSANLTESALLRNHEFGFVTDDSTILKKCQSYFDNLWSKAGSDLDESRLAKWEDRLAAYLVSGARPAPSSGLGDEGTDVSVPSPNPLVASSRERFGKAFVKFFGEYKTRADRTLSILKEVRESGSHWACSYPKTKRPRAVDDGDVMYIARLVRDPDDIVIYGRAIALRHVEGRDEASPEDISKRPWKATWPNYIRVHNAEFVGGTVGNGVSLNELMGNLGADAFRSTQRNAAKGTGNLNPRDAYKQQPSVELTSQGHAWVQERLELAMDRFGRLPAEDLAALDWPHVSAAASKG